MLLTIAIYVNGCPGYLRQTGNHPLQQREDEKCHVIVESCFHLASHFSLASIIGNEAQDN
jgi:hypothetical protein